MKKGRQYITKSKIKLLNIFVNFTVEDFENDETNTCNTTLMVYDYKKSKLLDVVIFQLEKHIKKHNLGSDDYSFFINNISVLS